MSRSTVFFLISFFIGASFRCVLSPQVISAKTITGSCGKQSTWEYDTTTKVMTISGKGAISKKIKKSKYYLSKNGNKRLYNVKTIIICEGITSIENCSVFANFKGHNDQNVSIQLPTSLKKISAKAFESSLLDFSSINIPEGVKTIEPTAFGLYPELEHISVSPKNRFFTSEDGVLFSKNKKTLVYYPRLKNDRTYTLPKNVKKIKSLAFAGQAYLTKIILPHRLSILGSGAFINCHNLKNINLADTKIKKITDYNGTKNKIYFIGAVELEETSGSTLEYQMQSHSYAGTFEGTAVTSITIPDSVRYLSSETFDRSNLQKIIFGKNFTGNINTGKHTHENKSLYLYDSNLKSIIIPKSNKKYCVKNNVLYSKNGKVLYQVLHSNHQKHFIINKKVTKIANGAFYRAGIHNCDTITVNGNLQHIGHSAFASSGLKKFYCKGNIKKIGKGAFWHNTLLKEFICEKNVKYIEEGAFGNCYKLKKIQFTGKISSIGKNAFINCQKLQKNLVI